MARGRRPSARDRRLRLLLDSHAALWWLIDDARLSTTARDSLAGSSEPLLSAATLFELSIKASLGKLELADEWAEELLGEGFVLLPITTAHARAYRDLPYVKVAGKAHRDPFDRMLAAQARVEGVPIVTRDPAVSGHGVPTIW